MTTSEDTGMQERLVRVETKLDLLISSLEPRHSDQEARLREQDIRLRAVEVAVSEIRTRVTLVAGGTGTAGGVIAAILAHLIGA